MSYGRYDNLPPGVTNEMIERQANGPDEGEKVSYCDSCIEAASEDGAGGFEEDALAIMGDEIGDHDCDEIETDGEIRCKSRVR